MGPILRAHNYMILGEWRQTLKELQNSVRKIITPVSIIGELNISGPVLRFLERIEPEKPESVKQHHRSPCRT